MNVLHDLNDLDIDDLRILGRLNATDVGVVRFADATPWERHESDELLIVLDGGVRVIAEDFPGAELSVGDLYIVPAGVWHRQEPHGPVTVLFATEAVTTIHRPVSAPDGGR